MSFVEFLEALARIAEKVCPIPLQYNENDLTL